MFRTACFFVVLALCAAIAPPRISLDLEEGPIRHSGSTDYTKTIKISNNDTVLPIAKAFDHVDEEVKVTTIIQLVDLDGTEKESQINTETSLHADASIKSTEDLNIATNPATTLNSCMKAQVQRSEYVFTYDAVDKANNKAEQLTFVLTINDPTAPKLTGNCTDATLEAGTQTYLEGACGNVMESCKANSPAGFDNYGNGGGCNTTVNATLSKITLSAVQDGASTTPTYADSTASLTCAQCKAMDTVLTFTCSDSAGIYGADNVNNTNTKDITLKCEDTKDPTVTPETNSTTQNIECGNATLIPDPVFENIGPYWNATTTTISTVDAANVSVLVSAINTTEGNFTTVWLGNDTCFSNTATHTRTYFTIDTTPPTFEFATIAGGLLKVNVSSHKDLHSGDLTVGKTLDGTYSWADITEIVDNALQDADNGWEIKDKCIHDDESKVTARTWYKCTTSDCSGNNALNFAEDAVPAKGKYIREYTVHDNSLTNNSVTNSHQIELIDAETPVITVQSCSNLSYVNDVHECDTEWAANLNGTYEDAGAKCSDFVDGALSHAVEVSGDVVNLNLAGGDECNGKTNSTYYIKYNCQDLEGLDAITATRRVFVSDTTPPKMINDTDFSLDIKYEAGYTYNDTLPVVSDDMCASPGYTGCITASSEVHFNDSATKIDVVDVKTPGTYKITYTASDCSGNLATAGNTTATELIRTVTIIDSMAPVIVLVNPTNNNVEFQNLTSSKTSYGTQTNAKTSLAGTANRKDADSHTIPTEINAVWVPSHSFKSPLMAESASVNGWFIGAIACAITGVALLGLATRKVSTEVPV